MWKKLDVTWKTIGGLIGLVTIAALIVAVIQLKQSQSASVTQDAAQSTLIVVLAEQLQVQREMATLQANALGSGPASTLIVNQIRELQSTAIALSTQEARIRQSPTAVEGTEATVTRSEVDKWSIGETSVKKVQICLEEAHNRPVPYHSYDKGETIPSNALIATGFWFDGGVHWNQLPVKPICINGDWGLFESTGKFQAPGPGSYWRIIP